MPQFWLGPGQSLARRTGERGADTVNGALPVLLTVTNCVALVVLIATPPKARDEGATSMIRRSGLDELDRADIRLGALRPRVPEEVAIRSDRIIGVVDRRRGLT